MIVVDASVLATALGDDGTDGRRARSRLAGEQLVAPDIIDLEVISVWRRLSAAGRIASDRASQAVDDLEAFPMRRVQHNLLVQRVWELRGNVTVYDAAYIAVAETIQATLVTADEWLASAPGPRCNFEILP